MHVSPCLIAPRSRNILLWHLFIFCFWPGCFDKPHICRTFSSFSFFWRGGEKKKKKYIRLFASALPHPLLVSSLVSSAVFALFHNVLRCTGRYLGCSRLDCYTDQQRASACFLFGWHTAHLPWYLQHTRTQTCTQRCIKDQSALSGWKVTVCLSRPRKGEGWEGELYLFL